MDKDDIIYGFTDDFFFGGGLGLVGWLFGWLTKLNKNHHILMCFLFDYAFICCWMERKYKKYIYCWIFLFEGDGFRGSFLRKLNFSLSLKWILKYWLITRNKKFLSKSTIKYFSLIHFSSHSLWLWVFQFQQIFHNLSPFKLCLKK